MKLQLTVAIDSSKISPKLGQGHRASQNSQSLQASIWACY